VLILNNNYSWVTETGEFQWFTPWYIRVGLNSPARFFMFIMAVLIIVAIISYLVENQNYKKVWRNIGIFLIRMIVIVETMVEISKEVPERIKENFVKERV